MRKTKNYGPTKFRARILRLAIDTLRSSENASDERISTLHCTTSRGNTSWGFDTVDEFLTDYDDGTIDSAVLQVFWNDTKRSFYLLINNSNTTLSIDDNSRALIERTFSIFEDARDADKSSLKPPSKVSIFIGHGRNDQWHQLKSHLQDKHGLSIVAYETGARAGHAIRDVLETMSKEASFALLVLTGEDRGEHGLRARQNVIHECGLFQGKLGFDRAILLVEEGVELASNFDGIQQLRFNNGRIAEVFGDVIATLRREFGPI